MSWPEFLPGRLRIERGSAADYGRLKRFHYCAGRPATWAGVWVIRYQGHGSAAQCAAVAVLSWPALDVAARQQALGLERWSAQRRRRFVNRHVRCISRVIVHPLFRGMGLGTRLVRHVLRRCPTRYVEAFARMGWVHPLFERAGMQRVDGPGWQVGRPVYYLLDRSAALAKPAACQ